MGDTRQGQVGQTTIEPARQPPPSATAAKETKDYKGFVAGVFSGITKLSGECRFFRSHLVVQTYSANLFRCFFRSIVGHPYVEFLRRGTRALLGTRELTKTQLKPNEQI